MSTAILPARVSRPLADLYAYRDLLLNFTVRELKLRYRGSVLGVAWSLLNPLLMMAIYTVVFTHVLRFGNLVPNYWALVLTGIVFWSFFSTGLTSASASFVRNGGLITKVYFPIEALPFSMVLAQFVNFLITLGILLIAAAIKGVPLGPPLVLLPVLVVATLALELGAAALIASVTVFFRDVEHLIAIGLTAWFYLTPIIYPLDARVVPASLLPLLKINPIAWYVDSFHSVLVRGQWPSWLMFGLALATSLLTLVLGYAVFLKVRPRLPEEV